MGEPPSASGPPLPSMQSRRISLPMPISRGGSPPPVFYNVTWSPFITSTTKIEPTEFTVPVHMSLPGGAARSQAVAFRFLNEGAANSVFRIIEPLENGSGATCALFRNGRIVPRAELVGRVLRISKGKLRTPPSHEIVRDFEKDVKPLFQPDELEGTVKDYYDHPLHQALDEPLDIYPKRSFEDFLMDYELVCMPQEVLVSMCTDDDVVRGARKVPFLSMFDEHAILLPDMSGVHGVSLMVEFKPKWLTQSPNAPDSAYRCRTCALHASRLAKTSTDPPPYICPLQLMNGNKKLIRNFILDKLRGQHSVQAILESVADRAVDYLTSGPGAELLLHLRKLQQLLDPHGMLQYAPVPLEDWEPVIYRRRLAMTFRDCSLFLRIPYIDMDSPIEAKLGDLDLKSQLKTHEWDNKEEELIGGGWYTKIEAGVHQCAIAEGWRYWCPHYM